MALPPHIHPTAIVDPQCVLAAGVEVGPHCIISGRVSIGENTRLIAAVHIQGPADIGADNTLYPGACIGFPAQDWKHKPGDATGGVRIGSGCLLREHVTIHAATKPDVPTTLGDKCFLMVGSHLGHDAWVGNNVVLVNHVLLAGHTKVYDNATLAGGTALHQFNRVGRLAFASGVALAMDVPPFCVAGERNTLNGVNLVGMRRNGISRDDITRVRNAFRDAIRRRLPRQEMIAKLTELGRDCPVVMEMATFVAEAKRPIAVSAYARRRNIAEADLE